MFDSNARNGTIIEINLPTSGLHIKKCKSLFMLKAFVFDIYAMTVDLCYYIIDIHKVTFSETYSKINDG